MIHGKRVRTNWACERHWQDKANFPDSERRRKSGGTPNRRRVDRRHSATPVVQTKPICPARGHKSRRRAVLPAKQSQFRADKKGQEPARLWWCQPGQLCETKPNSPPTDRPRATAGRAAAKQSQFPPWPGEPIDVESATMRRHTLWVGGMIKLNPQRREGVCEFEPPTKCCRHRMGPGILSV